jgi:phosphatidylserine/phosphatidylglycerophosphate/cardiolipin synthase-like enzyme
MRRTLALLLLLSACFVAGCQQAPGDPPVAAPPPPPTIEVYFSPKGGCTVAAAVRELGRAKATVLVQAYSFTSAPIAKALVEAHKRGVDVRVILDKSQRTAKYSEADFLVNMGIPTWIDARHAIAHNKIMVIDGATVITGSFNFTKAAEEHNAENMLVIRDKALAEKYAANWQAHVEHSERYEGRQVDAAPAEKPARKRKAA